MSGTTTYEAIDDRIAAEEIMVDHARGLEIVDGDRKSTRLNSSHR